MALLLSRLSKLRLGKSLLVRTSSLRLLSNGFSSSLLQTPPCHIFYADPCGEDLGKLTISYANKEDFNHLAKKVPLELVEKDPPVTIGASHGWVATLKEDGILRLQDDLNPFASDTDPKRISLPPLVTLPRRQTQIVTNMAMSSSSLEDQDCVVAVKLLGPQISFCSRPSQSSNPEWTNIRIENPCFHSSRVMFSKNDDMFRMPGSGGHLIGSWDLDNLKDKPKIQRLRFQNLPELTKAKRELLHSCSTSEQLVESRTTNETFLAKWYRKTFKISKGIAQMRTKAVMVFKLDKEGNAVYTQDIGHLCIYLSKSEPFCAPAFAFPGLCNNVVEILDADERAYFNLKSYIISTISTYGAPYYIPPQNIS